MSSIDSIIYHKIRVNIIFKEINKMKKKILMYFAIYILTFAAFAVDQLNLRVVPLNRIQWQSIQSQVNTNGWCHIKDQNVLLVITNGCPNIERLLPIFPPKPEIDLERNPLKIEGKRGKGREPAPYYGQSL